MEFGFKKMGLDIIEAAVEQDNNKSVENAGKQGHFSKRQIAPTLSSRWGLLRWMLFLLDRLAAAKKTTEAAILLY